jgi:hypothetical protein
MMRSSSAALLLCIFLLSRGLTNAQGKPEETRGKLPIVSAVSEIVFLDDAKRSLARARNFESKQAILDAVREYEGLIGRSEELPAQLKHSYEFYVVLAGAHLDAARTRVSHASSLTKSLDLTEQNQARISDHLKAVPSLVVAARDAPGVPELAKFRCDAYKLLAHGMFLTGTVNLDSKHLLLAIDTYKKVALCDKESGSQAQAMISYTKSVENDVSKKILRANNVAKVISKSLSISVPRVGSYLSMAIDLGYEFYKEKKKAPIPPALR